jgi:hypothetical protein
MPDDPNNDQNQTAANDPAEQAREDCASCVVPFDPDDMSDTVDGLVCQGCIDEHYRCCDDCGDMVDHDNGTTVYDQFICDGCYNDNYFVCERCEDHALSENSQHVTLVMPNGRNRTESWCSSCADDYSYWCDDCSEQYHTDYRCSCGEGGCVIRDYSDRAAAGLGPFGAPFQNPDGTYNVLFGVELEVECRHEREEALAGQVLSVLGEDYAIAKHDGSLSNGGFEIVTAPSTPSEHAKRFKSLLVDKRVSGICSWNSNGGKCGMHVHASRGALSALHIGRIVRFIGLEANRSFIEAVAGRRSNSYSELSETSITDLPDHRYNAVNLTNRKTIEFRLFKGTLKYSSFMKNVEFCDAVIKFCKNASNVCTYKDLVAWVMKSASSYPFLSKWMRERGYDTSTSADDTAGTGDDDPAPTPKRKAKDRDYPVEKPFSCATLPPETVAEIRRQRQEAEFNRVFGQFTANADYGSCTVTNLQVRIGWSEGCWFVMTPTGVSRTFYGDGITQRSMATPDMLRSIAESLRDSAMEAAQGGHNVNTWIGQAIPGGMPVAIAIMQGRVPLAQDTIAQVLTTPGMNTGTHELFDLARNEVGMPMAEVHGRVQRIYDAHVARTSATAAQEPAPS